jgi:hypothetical protein
MQPLPGTVPWLAAGLPTNSTPSHLPVLFGDRLAALLPLKLLPQPLLLQPQALLLGSLQLLLPAEAGPLGLVGMAWRAEPPAPLHLWSGFTWVG